MTRKARQLGMAATTFRNASGLPDAEQVTTARDMVTLGAAAAGRLPQALPAVRHAHLHLQRTRRSATTTRCCRSYEGTDGIKTGYTRASGLQPRGLRAARRQARGRRRLRRRQRRARATPPCARSSTWALVKASTEKTRKPAPLLVGAGPAAAPSARSAPVPTPRRVARPRPQIVTAAAPPPVAPAAPARHPAIALAGHRDRARALRPRAPRAQSAAAPRRCAGRHRPASRMCWRGRSVRAAVGAARRPACGRDAGGEACPCYVAGSTRKGRRCHRRAAPGAPPSTLRAQAAQPRARPPTVAAAASRSRRSRRQASRPQTCPAAHPLQLAPGAFHIQIGAYQSQPRPKRPHGGARASAPAACSMPIARRRDDAVKQGDKLYFAPASAASRRGRRQRLLASSRRLQIDCFVMKAE